MNRQLKFIPEFFRDGDLQRCARRNAKPQLWQRRDIFHFAESLIENRHSGKNCRVCPRKIDKNGARRSVVTQDNRHAASNQRREQIAKAVRMRERNYAEIKIGIANAHRLTNLIAIGEELFAAKPDGARCSCRARS